VGRGGKKRRTRESLKGPQIGDSRLKSGLVCKEKNRCSERLELKILGFRSGKKFLLILHSVARQSRSRIGGFKQTSEGEFKTRHLSKEKFQVSVGDL